MLASAIEDFAGREQNEVTEHMVKPVGQHSGLQAIRPVWFWSCCPWPHSCSAGFLQRCGVAIQPQTRTSVAKKPSGPARVARFCMSKHRGKWPATHMPMCLCRRRSRPPRCLALAVKLCDALAGRGLATPGLAVFLADHLSQAQHDPGVEPGVLNHSSCLPSRAPEPPSRVTCQLDLQEPRPVSNTFRD